MSLRVSYEDGEFSEFEDCPCMQHHLYDWCICEEEKMSQCEACEKIVPEDELSVSETYGGVSRCNSCSTNF